MKHLRLLLTLSGLLATSITVHAQLQIPLAYNWKPPRPVPEVFINNPNTGFGGFTQMDPLGRPCISFNIPRLNQPALMLLFLRVHEYGHVEQYLNHENFASIGQMEAAADCWAGKELAQSDPQLLNQILGYFVNVMGNTGGGDFNHGTGLQMAKVIEGCVSGTQRSGIDPQNLSRVTPSIAPPPFSGGSTQRWVLQTGMPALPVPPPGPPDPEANLPIRYISLTEAAGILIPYATSNFSALFSPSGRHLLLQIQNGPREYQAGCGPNNGFRKQREYSISFFTTTRAEGQMAYDAMVADLESSFPDIKRWTISTDLSDIAKLGFVGVGRGVPGKLYTEYERVVKFKNGTSKTIYGRQVLLMKRRTGDWVQLDMKILAPTDFDGNDLSIIE